MSKEGLAERDRLVLQYCQDAGLPVAVTMAGGYAPAIEDTVDRARHYGAIAHDALAIFPETNYKAALCDAIAFCVDRVN